MGMLDEGRDGRIVSPPEPFWTRVRRILKSLKFWVLLVAIVLGAGTASAQTTTGGSKPSIFDTKAACDAAMASGNFSFYEPKYFGLKENNPVNGTTRIKVVLEADECRHVKVVGGFKWIPEKKGTEKRAHKAADGSIVVYARHDCGNDDDTDTLTATNVVATPAPTAVAAAVQAPAPAPAPMPTQMAYMQVATPCVDPIAFVKQTQVKDAKKANYGMNCTPDGAVTITVEQHKPGRGFWSRFWNPAGDINTSGQYNGSGIRSGGGGGTFTAGSGSFGNGDGNNGPAGALLKEGGGWNYIWATQQGAPEVVPAGAPLSSGTGTNTRFGGN